MDIDDEISLAIGKIINGYGSELLGKSLEIKGLLMDLLPKYKKERMLILTALSCGVGEELYKSKKKFGAVTDKTQNTCKRYLVEAYVSENAADMVIHWLVASFEVTEALPKPKRYEDNCMHQSMQDFDLPLADDTLPVQNSHIPSENGSNLEKRVDDSVSRMRSIASRFLSCKAKKAAYQGDYSSQAKYDASGTVILQGDLHCDVFIFDDNIRIVGEKAFANARSLESVTFTNNIESIEKEAFMNCSALTNIIMLRSMKKIGEGIFKGCIALTTANLPANMLEIPMAMFKKCISLTCVNMPSALETIGDEAFRECSSLESITISDTVKCIGDRAFMGCSSLRTIMIGPGIKRIGRDAFVGCAPDFHIDVINNMRVIQYCILHKIRYNRLR